MKKQLLILVMFLLPMVANADNSGSYGEDITWTYVNETRTLFISGSGTMPDCPYKSYDIIPWYSFRYSIQNVVIEDGVSSIGNYAFIDCQSLTSIVISNSVTIIGEWAFNKCSNLTSITIPNSVISIGYAAFLGCGLIDITIPNSVTCIGERTFEGCTGLTSINIPNSVTTIGCEAFRECTGLTSITIPNSVTIIEDNTFYDCTGLITVNIPNSVTSIGESAFELCSSLTAVTIPNSVTYIGGRAFSGCVSLTSVTIPNSVTIIDMSAFNGCSSLTSVTIPNSVTTIESWAFEGCSGLTSIVVESGNTIYDSRNNCNAIIETASDMIIVGCMNTVIPNSVTTIGSAAFWNCTSLTSITIPNSVKSIGDYAFARCTGLTSVTIPNSVTSIGESAFENCSGLTSITIGSGVKGIGSYAFANCQEITDVYCYAEDVPNTYSNAFENSYIEKATLHVPQTSIENYKETEPWKDFKEIVKIDMPKHTLTYMVGDDVYKTYEIEEGASITPEPAPTKEGYTFSGWSKIPETMPDHDVTVTGTFTINKYKLIYKVDDEVYKSYDVEYGKTITPEAEPTKEGYTFSGWSVIPETMPAHDVSVTGTFSKGAYKLIYKVDDEVYKTISYDYGDVITPEPAPTKEGYTFSGWSEIPETMPAHDVTVTGTFSINSYKLTYMIDNAVYKEVTYEYGATITPEPQPEGDYQTFDWTDLPQTMPAHDVTVYANYTTGIAEIIMAQGAVRIYSPDGKPRNELQKGLNIVRMNDGTVKKVVVR